MKYLGEIMGDRVFTSNTLIVSPTGSGKTYYIINSLCNNEDKKVLYLCDNNNLEDQVLLENKTKSVKKNKLSRGFGKKNIIVDTYKGFGIKIRKDIDNSYVNSFDLIIADEIHNLISYFNMKEDEDLFHVIKALMQKYDNTPILMFTATPYYLNELSKKYPGIDRNYEKIDFSKSKEIMRYISRNNKYINHQSQIKCVLEEYKHLFIESNIKSLIYTNKVEDMKFIENICFDLGLKPICLWSINNKNYDLDNKQQMVRDHLINKGELLEPYNVLIINRATETGVNIYDDKMQLVIVNTTNLTQQVQARGRVRHDVDLLVVKTNDDKKVDTITIKDDMLNVPLIKNELEVIIKEYNLRDDRGKYITVNKLNKFLSNVGYNISTNRKTVDGKKNTYYMVKRTKN